LTIWRLLQLIGTACLVVVVLTHVAETLELFPEMGWGLPTSPGHYLDLVSAILGCTLLPLGFITLHADLGLSCCQVAAEN
jgi:hypothetical protein